MNHCSSEGATVGIQSYLSSRLKIQFKIKISKPKTQFSFSSISNHNTFQFHFNINIQNYISKFFSIQFKNQIKMSENIELSYVWDHTIIKFLNHDIKSKMGNMNKRMGCVQQIGRFQFIVGIHNNFSTFNHCLLHTS